MGHRGSRKVRGGVLTGDDPTRLVALQDAHPLQDFCYQLRTEE